MQGLQFRREIEIQNDEDYSARLRIDFHVKYLTKFQLCTNYGIHCICTFGYGAVHCPKK
jgi:hypothetical protein